MEMVYVSAESRHIVTTRDVVRFLPFNWPVVCPVDDNDTFPVTFPRHGQQDNSYWYCCCGVCVVWCVWRDQSQPSPTDRGLLGNLQTLGGCPGQLVMVVRSTSVPVSVVSVAVSRIFISSPHWPDWVNATSQWSGAINPTVCCYWSWKMLSRENLITHN